MIYVLRVPGGRGGAGGRGVGGQTVMKIPGNINLKYEWLKRIFLKFNFYFKICVYIYIYF